MILSDADIAFYETDRSVDADRYYAPTPRDLIGHAQWVLTGKFNDYFPRRLGMFMARIDIIMHLLSLGPFDMDWGDVDGYFRGLCQSLPQATKDFIAELDSWWHGYALTNQMRQEIKLSLSYLIS